MYHEHTWIVVPMKWYCSKYCSEYRVFSLTWPASMQIYWNKRKRLHKKRGQLPEDWFGTPTWPPFHCFGTPIWPSWRHVKTLYMAVISLPVNLPLLIWLCIGVMIYCGSVINTRAFYCDKFSVIIFWFLTRWLRNFAKNNRYHLTIIRNIPISLMVNISWEISA